MIYIIFEKFKNLISQ